MATYGHLEELISVLIFADVENAADIAAASTAENTKWVAVNLEYVVSTYHMRFSALKSLINQENSKLKTKQNVVTEILYQLSSTTNINEAVKQYGVTSASNQIGFIVINGDGNCHNDIRALVKGIEVDCSRFDTEMLTRTKISEIAKTFKTSVPELEMSGIESAVCTRIAIKDI